MGQLIGFIYMFFLIYSYFQKTANKLLLYQSLAFLFKGIHYFLIGGMSGAITSVISFIRNLFFTKVSSKLLMLFFIILYLIIGFITYNGFFSILPVAATIFYSFFVYIKNLKYLRISNLFISFIWLSYNIYLLSYAGILVQLILIISSVFSIIYLDKKK